MERWTLGKLIRELERLRHEIPLDDDTLIDIAMNMEYQGPLQYVRWEPESARIVLDDCQ